MLRLVSDLEGIVKIAQKSCIGVTTWLANVTISKLNASLAKKLPIMCITTKVACGWRSNFPTRLLLPSVPSGRTNASEANGLVEVKTMK